MLHALTNKNKNNVGRTQDVDEPKREFRPPTDGSSLFSLSKSRSSQPGSPGSWSRLQSTYGNQAVLRMVQNSNQATTKCPSCAKGRSICPDCAREKKLEQRSLVTTTTKEVTSGHREIATTGSAQPAIGGDAGPTLPGRNGGGEGGPTPLDKPDAGTTCPTETVTMRGAKCGTKYGAIAKYCYSGANGWWFKESVKNAPGPLCQPGDISQTSDPGQSPLDNCIEDKIFDNNGPPSKVAPCTDTTYQTVFAGPTKDTVEQCKYNHEQVIKVTKPSDKGGKVITTTQGASDECEWTA